MRKVLRKCCASKTARWSRPVMLGLLIVSTVILFASPGFAADCVDSDGDGYVASCSGCDLPSGKQCGDCNDGNAFINPDAQEICGDDIDNNCDGVKLEPGGFCLICPPGDSDPDCDAVQADICRTGSNYVCSGDGLSLVCPEPEDGYQVPVPEVPYSLTCHDGLDNDCNGLIDGEDSACTATERCNGLDDDFDGSVDEDFLVGSSCSEGVGACERSGNIICDGESSTKCSAIPGTPKTEAFGAGNTCSDGKDNDCDGLTDDADPGCAPSATAEICDGVDNDLDGEIDEDFKEPGYDLGMPCTVGVGACENTGVKVCTADGSGTICSVFPLAASIEGPSGPTCSDGLDNDCDGLVDTGDPSCDAAAAQLLVECALPYTVGKPGADCNGQHEVRYKVFGYTTPALQVSAEFLGLSPEGELLGILTGVMDGDEAHLASRLDPWDFKMVSRSSKKRTWHQVFAPVPLLHVTARDGDAVAEAYCSMIPYLDVTKPDGAVVSVSSGDVIEVLSAIPLVRPETLMIKVDGEDILPGLGIDPATDFPGGPYNGTVMINGQMVEVQNLVVASSNGDIDMFSSNTLAMTLKNLGGGGHIVYVDGEPVPMRSPLTDQCLIDDVADAGTVSALSVEITSPADQESVPGGTVYIEGEVKHGRTIAGLKLGGKPADVSGQVFTPGDGMNTADQYVLNFNEPLLEVDLSVAAAGNAPLGTVQRGANKVTADATDDLGNRAFDTRMFAVGNVLSPAQSASIAAQVESKLKPLMKAAYSDFLLTASQEVQNAFVAGVEKSAVTGIFQNVCSAAVDEFKNRIDASIRGTDLGSITVDPDCSCKVVAPLVLRDVIVTGTSSCYSEFRSGEFDGVFELPDVEIVIGAYKRCQTNGIFGECFTRTTVNVEARTKLIDPVFRFTITEEGILTNTPPTDDMKSFVIGNLRYPGSEPGDNLEGNIPGVWSNSSGTACWGAGFCSFFEAATGFLIEVFTFGLVDATDVFDFVNFEFELTDLQEVARAGEPDPVGIGNIAIDSQVVEEFGQAAFTPELADVKITPDGLTALFSAGFETQAVDPDVEETPGAALSPAPAPGVPQGTTAQNAFIVLADDTINQLFASMAASGGLKTTCQDTDKTVGDLLPADCETLTADTDLATATIQGLCHGIKGDDCESLTGSTIILQATEQGVCHGVRGDDCSTIPVDGLGITERGACNITPDLNLTATDPLLFCAKQSIPPQLLINKTSGPQDDLDVSLLLNDLTVAIVVDRPANGALDGELSGTPNCFAGEASSLADCYLYTACVDITIGAGMSLDNSECGPGETGFVFSVNSVGLSGQQAGVMCGGAATQTDDAQVTEQAASDTTVQEITNNVESFTPPLCAKGLNLGGLLTFTNPKLIAIDTGGPDGYADYFGIIGEVD